MSPHPPPQGWGGRLRLLGLMAKTNFFPWRAWWFHSIASSAAHGVFTLLGGHDYLISGQELALTPLDVIALIVQSASIQAFVFGGIGGVGVFLIWWGVLRTSLGWAKWYSDTCQRLDGRYRRPMGSFEEYSQVLAVSILGPLIWSLSPAAA